MIDPVAAIVRERYVMRAIDAKRPEVRIVPELRRTVRFQCLNLMTRPYRVDRDFDVIFLPQHSHLFRQGGRKTRCSGAFAITCGKGGFLILGHSESLAGPKLSAMRQMAPTIFRRAA